MLGWSRFWLFMMTLAAAVSAALLVTLVPPLISTIKLESAEDFGQMRQSAELLIALGRRDLRERALTVAGDRSIGEALTQLGQSPVDPLAIHKVIDERLLALQNQLKTPFIVLFDAQGHLFSQIGESNISALEGLSLVGEALHGQVADDSVVRGDQLTHLSAAPIFGNGQALATVLIGQDVGEPLLQTLNRQLNLDLALLVHGKMVAATNKALFGKLLANPMIKLLQKSNSKTAPLEVSLSEHAYLAGSLPLVTEGQDATLILLCPLTSTPPLRQLIEDLLHSDLTKLPLRPLLPIGIALLLALLIGFLLLSLEPRGPLKRLALDIEGLAVGAQLTLDPRRHARMLRKLAAAVNRLRPATLLETPTRSLPSNSRPHLLQTTAMRSGRNTPPPPRPNSSAFQAAAPTLIPRPVPLEPPPAAPQKPAGISIGDDDMHELSDASLVILDADPVLSESETSPFLRAPVKKEKSLYETLEQRVPDLEAQCAETSGVQKAATEHSSGEGLKVDWSPTRDENSNADQVLEREIRQVYEAFISARRQLGESVDDVPFERFMRRLQTNRSELMQRHGCQGVKFQVYIRDGRAALRATPKNH